MSVVLVGVDGSNGSVHALRFALEEAAVRGATVRAVTAWHVPPVLYAEPHGTGPLTRPDYEAAARGRLHSAIARARSAAPHAMIEAVTVEGDPLTVLVDEARQADLLVVGARGLGGFRGLLLGSISQRCIQRVATPLVVVPPAAASQDARVDELPEELPLAYEYERPVLHHEP